MTCSPLPPVHFSDGFQPFVLKALAQVLRRQLDRLERDIRRRIEIEDHPVRVIDRIDRSAPGMQFDRAHLDHFQQAFFILDIEIFVFLALVPEGEGLDVRAETPAGIALEKTLAADAGGAAQQAEGPVDDLRQDKGGHARVVFGQFALGNVARPRKSRDPDA